MAELTWNTWRDHLILEYEIPKYDGDLGSPNVFVALDDADRPAQGRRHPRSLPEPATPGVVRRRHVPRAAAAAGHGGQRPRALRRGLLRIEGGALAMTSAGHRPQGLHRLGHGAAAARGGSRGGGARHRPLRGVQRSGIAGRDVAGVRLDLRDVEPRHLEGFEAVIHLAALSNDPLGDLDPQLTYDINHGASVRLARAARQAGVERFLFASSCSLYGASGGDAPLTEEAPFNPGDALRRVEGPRRAGRLEAGDRQLQPRLLPQRHRLRRLAVPAGRHHGQQPRRLRRHDRRGADQERRIAVAPAGPRRGHLPGVPGRPRGRPRSAPTTRPSTSGSARRTSGCARWRTWSSRSSPAAGCEYAAGASADTRDYRVDFAKIQRVLPEFRPQWTVRKGVEELYEAYRRLGLTADEFLGGRYVRLAEIKRLQGQARLDDQLRWTRCERWLVRPCRSGRRRPGAAARPPRRRAGRGPQRGGDPGDAGRQRRARLAAVHARDAAVLRPAVHRRTRSPTSCATR